MSNTSEVENVCEFVDLIGHEDYEILNVYPFTIRKKSNHYENLTEVMDIFVLS